MSNGKDNAQKKHDQKRNTENEKQRFSRWKRDAAVAMAAGGGAALLMGLGAYTVGHVTGSEARVLVDAIIPTSRYLCAAITTAAATILALMLTMLGMTVNSRRNLDSVFFSRIKQIAFYDMLVLIMAICFLVLHCIPVTKSDELPTWWYSTVYYTLLGVSAVLAGTVIAVVAMLYAALRNLIDVLGLDRTDHPLYRSQTDNEATSEAIHEEPVSEPSNA